MPRIRHQLRVKLKSPVLISEVQAVGNYRGSIKTIPGRTLRGAVAAALRLTSDDLFEALFALPAADQIHFGTLFPAIEQTGLLTPTRFSCKRFPGLSEAGSKDDDHHGAFDTLARQYAFEVAASSPESHPGFLDEFLCPVCFGPTEALTTPESYGAQLVTTATTHVAINRVRHTAQRAQLYVREGIESFDEYIGWLDIPEASADDIINLLSGLELQIGANRSRGMGEAVIKELETAPVLRDRQVRELNRTIEQCFEFYSAISSAPIPSPALQAARRERYFTLDLLSPAVLLDDKGMPAAAPDFRRADGSVWATVERQWTSWERIGGWHAAAGLPRRSHIGVNGVFLCRLADDATLDELRQLHSIGLLCEQGFGQVIICDPVHTSIM